MFDHHQRHLIDRMGAELAERFVNMLAEGRSPEYIGKFMGAAISLAVEKANTPDKGALRDALTDSMHEQVQLTKIIER